MSTSGRWFVNNWQNLVNIAKEQPLIQNELESRANFVILCLPSQIYLNSDAPTQPVQTLFLFKSIWIRPQGSQGCQKIRFFFSQMKLFSFCAKIAPKRHKLQKSSKLKKRCQKKTLFSLTFSNLLHFEGNISAPNLK